MSCLHYLFLFVYSGVQHILRCFCFVFLRLVYPMLPVSSFYGLSNFDCPSAFYNVYLNMLN
jgi:hypothetical protein